MSARAALRRPLARCLTARAAGPVLAGILAVVGSGAGTLLLPAHAEAQGRMRGTEARLLRESAALESQGDYDGAEAVLRSLLEENPASSGGLFALERVLRAKGDIASILPSLSAFLDEQPRSSGVRSLELRVLADVDSTDAVRRRSGDWLAADPGQEVPYREISRVWERSFGADEALDLLRRGRADVGREDALALEIGDLLASGGRIEEAADEWALAVGRDAAQVATVTRRVTGLDSEEDSERAGRRLVRALGDADAVDRRRAGARIALDLGLPDQALALSREVAGELDGRARTTFLTDVARRARDHDLVDVAAWAYDELGGEAGSPAERRQFDMRIVDVSLAAGDTTAALEAQRRLVESFSTGSVDRRRATARLIRLEGARSEPSELRAMLSAFRDEFPNAPELDELAATVAGALQSRGDPRGAAAVLEGIDGPRSSLERAYLLLAEGDVVQGRQALLLALTGLPPTEATPVIRFAGLLGRSSPEATEALAEAAVAAHAGRAAEAAQGLAGAVDALEAEERAPLLAQAARMAEDGGEARIAAEIRTRLVTDHADEPEFAEAALALARFHARTPRGHDEAIRLLEELIGSRPNAALVPDARLELERLRGRSR